MMMLNLSGKPLDEYMLITIAGIPGFNYYTTINEIEYKYMELLIDASVKSYNAFIACDYTNLLTLNQMVQDFEDILHDIQIIKKFQEIYHDVYNNLEELDKDDGLLDVLS